MSERLREERAVGALSQKFTYRTVEDIPPGVNPKQLDFFREASENGIFMHVKPRTATLITEYFTTEATYEDLAMQYGVALQTVSERIFTGISKLHTMLHKKKPQLAVDNTYPLEEMKKGKDLATVMQSERSKGRTSEAAKLRAAEKRRVRQQSVASIDIFVAHSSHSE